MHEITALEIGLAIKELKGKVIGSYLKKFYDLGNGSFRFSLHNSNGNLVLYCNLLSSLNETGFIEEAGAATNFAIAVRRKIEDSRITDFYQRLGDRIAVIEVQARGERHRIVLEMFGKGNLILINDKDEVELCYRIMLYKDREIKPRARYMFPKSESVDIEALDREEIERILHVVAGEESKMIVGLSKFLNVGPVYLEDVITSAGLNPKERLSDGGILALRDSIMRFMEKVGAPSPLVYLHDGAIIDYAVFPLRKYEGTESNGCSSISDMLDRVNVSGRGSSGEEQEADTSEIDSIIEKQRAQVKEFVDESATCAAEGKRIFERMGEINELIIRVRENKRLTLQELRAEFPDMNITELNLKDKIIAIDV